MNLLHSIKARNADQSINVIIEIPKDSQAKIEYSLDQENFAVDRVINPQLSYPFNYGFIPETWGTDNDPLDAVVLSSAPLKTGDQIKTRVIGVLATTDQEGPDSKLITVPLSEKDPLVANATNIDSLNPKLHQDIQYFYKNYKLNEPGKWVDINGFLPKEKAEETLSDAITHYHHHFQN